MTNLIDQQADKYVSNTQFGFPPFLTGDFRFGIPDEDSDVDLVLMMTHEEFDRFAEAVGQSATAEQHEEYGRGRVSLRFENLNLIICLQPKHYLAFQMATQKATQIAEGRGQPLLKEEAADLFVHMRQEMGIE